MDFFDPEKQKRHSIRLSIGYVVIGLAVLLATIVLWHLAYGYGLDREGRLIQNGLVFVSTQPEGADIYLDGERHKDRTNARLNLPAGQYVLELARDGYRTWKRALVVEGGKVVRYDYPLLFPADLRSVATKQYSEAPTFSAQSPDRRWLMVAAGGNRFDVLDTNSRELTVRTIELSSELLAAGSVTTGWELVEWSNDNRHVVLRRLYDRLGQAGSEYILVDREDVARSRNLSIALGLTPSSLSLRAGLYDRYYLFDQPRGQVLTADLSGAAPRPILSNVLAFTSDGDVFAYVTSEGAEAGQVLVKIQSGNDAPLTVRSLPANSQYPLDLGVYAGRLYVAAGASSDNRVFVYGDPIGELRRNSGDPLVPTSVLRVTGASSVEFSPSRRFVIAENAGSFSVYDAETDRGYAYKVPVPATARVFWLDDFRLVYPAGDGTTVFDYDGVYQQILDLETPLVGRVYISADAKRLFAADTANQLVYIELRTERDR